MSEREIKEPPKDVAGFDPTRAGANFDWDGRAAARAVDFFPAVLTHPDKSHSTRAGDPFVLQPWQEAYVATLFGWKRKDKTRRFKESLLAIPRKNGKSTLLSGIALYCLAAEGERAAQIYSAACDRSQASLIYNMASRMVYQNKYLLSRLRPIDSTKRITYREMGSVYAALSGDASPAHGTKPYVVLFDELHTQRDRKLYDNLQSGQGASPNSLFLNITTAGWDRNSICHEVWRYARSVRDGALKKDDPYFLPAIYEMKEGEDWESESVWDECNPNLGVTISRDFLREHHERARSSPGYENTFRNLYLNQWCVAAGTLFWMEDGSRRKAEDLQPEDVVISFDEETQGLVKGRVSAVKPMPASAIYRIRTARGRIIRTNSEHPFWIRTGSSARKRYGWRKAKDLQPGDRVLSALSRPCLTRGSLRIDAEGSYFLGLMIGDGTCNGSPRLTTADKELVAAFSEFVDGQGDAVKARPDGWHYDAVHKVKGNLKRTATRKWLQARGVWGKTCYTKRIPDCVWKAGPAGWAAFISGYLDTDGHVGKEAIIFVSCNRELLGDAQDLLAYLGIQSDLRERSGGPGWRLEIRDSESFRICQEVLAPRVARKAAALEILPRSAGENNSDQRAYDRVAEVVIEPAEETIGVSVDGWHTHVTNGLVTHNTEQAIRWLSMRHWDACGGDMPDLEGVHCWGALDMSATTDITAFVLVFPLPHGHFACKAWFWIPEETAERKERVDAVPYRQWKHEGHVFFTPGNRIDHFCVRDDIMREIAQYNVQGITVDRALATLVTRLLQDSFDPDKITEFPQTIMHLSGPSKVLERIVLGGELHHGGNPVLRWMAGNVGVEDDKNENIRPVKSKSTGRIDGIVSLIMGLGAAGAAEPVAAWSSEDGV